MTFSPPAFGSAGFFWSAFCKFINFVRCQRTSTFFWLGVPGWIGLGVTRPALYLGSYSMPYVLGEGSRNNLDGVNPDLIAVVEKAITLTIIDFSVVEGVRTLEKQRELYKTGASQTMDSMHLNGRAVDLAPWIEGVGTRYDFGLFLPIAGAMRDAGVELGVEIVWGGCWRTINRYPDLSPAIGEYVQRKCKLGQIPFIDAPHFQLSRASYPN